MEKIIGFQSFDGLKLEGTLCTPNSGSVKGSALLVHGIQTNRDEYGFYSSMSQYLSEHGIATFRFDNRANEKYLEHITDLLTLTGVLNDIYEALGILKSLSDNGPLTIIGASFGGGLSHFFANKHPEVFEKCILLAPVLQYRIDYIKDEQLLSTNNKLADNGIDQLDGNNYLITSGRKFSRAIINELGHFDAVMDSVIPTTIIHGANDTSVKIEYSKAFVNVAKNISLIEIDGVEHGFAQPGDEDLNHPITLKNHREVYGRILKIMAE